MKSPYWHIPKMWQGETVFVIGGGPSLKEMDWTPFRSRNVVGCNDAYLLGDWVDFCYFGDERWHRIHSQLPEFVNFKNPRVTCRHDLLGKPHIDHVLESWAESFVEKDSVVGWKGNTGASAVDFAWKLGASRIVLLGYDMKLGKDGHFNWHRNLVHPFMNQKTVHAEATLDKFIGQFVNLEEDRRKRAPGLEILNANPDSGLAVFRKVKLEDVL